MNRTSRFIIQIILSITLGLFIVFGAYTLASENDCDNPDKPMSYKYHFKAEITYKDGKKYTIMESALGRDDKISIYHPSWYFSGDCMKWYSYVCNNGDLEKRTKTFGCGITQYRILSFYKKNMEKDEKTKK